MCFSPATSTVCFPCRSLVKFLHVFRYDLGSKFIGSPKTNRIAGFPPTPATHRYAGLRRPEPLEFFVSKFVRKPPAPCCARVPMCQYFPRYPIVKFTVFL